MWLIESFKKKKLILLNIFLTFYVGINLVGGERGLISYFEKKQILQDFKKKELVLIDEIKDLDFKNSLLSNNLDLDYVETLIRERFLFGKKGETIYIIKKDEN